MVNSAPSEALRPLNNSVKQLRRQVKDFPVRINRMNEGGAGIREPVNFCLHLLFVPHACLHFPFCFPLSLGESYMLTSLLKGFSMFKSERALERSLYTLHPKLSSRVLLRHWSTIDGHVSGGIRGGSIYFHGVSSYFNLATCHFASLLFTPQFYLLVIHKFPCSSF